MKVTIREKDGGLKMGDVVAMVYPHITIYLLVILTEQGYYTCVDLKEGYGKHPDFESLEQLRLHLMDEDDGLIITRITELKLEEK